MNVHGDAQPDGAAPPTAADARPLEAEDAALVQAMHSDAAGQPAPTYWLTRWLFLRAIGFIYTVAFLILHNQMLPLFGAHGLLPARYFVSDLHVYSSFWRVPGLFWFDVSDRALTLGANVGLGLSLLVLAGVDNALVMVALWALYLSFVHVGQVFYGYGWESLLLESGFLAIFLCPCTQVLSLRDRTPPPLPVIFMLRWLLFRVMFGAGLIKLRGDPCWRDLTCLAYHYETQPVPHPLSWLLNQAPLWFHKLGVAYNHLVELIAPFFLLLPRRARHTAGALTVVFQIILILSGNLSFLNWLTIAVAIACFDDQLLSRFMPRALVERVGRAAACAQPNPARMWTVGALSVLVLVLSYAPVANMLSPHQRMNTSFEPFHLVNSYGAFGSVSKHRNEIILEGTRGDASNPSARWVAYEFKCKPGRVTRAPCWITPYHYRLDWQMWFAALSNYQREPWIVHLIYKLLHNDAGALSLLSNRPFPGRPPRYIRAEFYRYRFTHWGQANGAFWKRKRIGTYLPPLSADNPSLLEFLHQQGLLRDGDGRAAAR